ncbi:hypothetical protein QAD02_016930 [Eretmocerus hayati]|uniref:Uncharacterized protein n=1 Tax=Eretmocerus hayati TaxID=131215 RepID=A0ACC2PCG2_9HYME|nr:hypothetical protein QAD02_016930 [Eretmocerus hayati]
MSRASRRSAYAADPYYEPDYPEPQLGSIVSRRFRSYDEYSQGSGGASHDDYELVDARGPDGLSCKLLSAADDELASLGMLGATTIAVHSVSSSRRHGGLGLPLVGPDGPGPPHPPPPLSLLHPPPPDIRHLQKERCHLLEQLEECHSSGDEQLGFAPKKRAKLLEQNGPLLLGGSAVHVQDDDEPEIASLLVTSHPGRKGMEVRRVSDSKIVLHHASRRSSCDGRGSLPCKRRRDTNSRHHEHHEGSRPGTPLVDERPENIMPSEPRRFRERSQDGPLSLPLPRFATQMLNNASSGGSRCASREGSTASLGKIGSPPAVSLNDRSSCNASSGATVLSPRSLAQPPASPPPRQPSPSPASSSDSEAAPQSPSLEERIRSLDEKYEKWSGSRAIGTPHCGDLLSKLDVGNGGHASTIDSSTRATTTVAPAKPFRFRHRLLELDAHEVQPSDIVKSVLAKRSVFDEDSKRLENLNDNLQYPFPSHPATPVTPAPPASVKTVSPELPPLPLPQQAHAALGASISRNLPVTPTVNATTTATTGHGPLPTQTILVASSGSAAFSTSTGQSTDQQQPPRAKLKREHRDSRDSSGRHSSKGKESPSSVSSSSSTTSSSRRSRKDEDATITASPCSADSGKPASIEVTPPPTVEPETCLQEKKEREDKERRERERREQQQHQLLQQEKERRDREERERKEKLELEQRERRERERKEKEERERREHEERERKLQQQQEKERLEKERLRKEREEQERREMEERDRLERERRREEKERLEREKKQQREKEERERLEREKRKEREERERLDKERRDKEEKERADKERHEREERRKREELERRLEKEKRREREASEKIDKEKSDARRERPHEETKPHKPPVPPAPTENHDGPNDDEQKEAKRLKISSEHRRDSKDKSSSKQNRRPEERCNSKSHRSEPHRTSRDSRESRDSVSTQDSRDGKDSLGDNLLPLPRESSRGEGKENNHRDSSVGKEKQRKKSRTERSFEKEPAQRERSPKISRVEDPEKEFLSSDVDEGILSTHEMQGMRIPSATDTDSDEPKKHSIFDIVDDEPAYISMYDKVKARSTRNNQKLEEEKRQVRLKDKFSQLKQSRARREEKKQSTSWDGDSVSSKALTEDEGTSESDSTRTKSLSRKCSRSRIHSDTSEDELYSKPNNIKTERYMENDVDLGFADSEEKHHPCDKSIGMNSNVMVNNVSIKDELRTSDEDERMSISFHSSHPIVPNNHDRDSRKKSHKKKQKRQKNSMSSEDGIKLELCNSHEHKIKTEPLCSSVNSNHVGDDSPNSTSNVNLTGTTFSENEDGVLREKKAKSKKDKRRDRNAESKTKARRKRLNRQEARDSQRMEDIFGPLSDDLDEPGSGNGNSFFNHSGYHSDSDADLRSPDSHERIDKKQDKRHRNRHPIHEEENSIDLAEAGREIEAKLLGLPNSPKSATSLCCNDSNNEHDVFRFTDDNDSVDPTTPSSNSAPEKIKERKKKRKKSKEERSRKDYHHHHHHHHHHHQEEQQQSNVGLPNLDAEGTPPRTNSPVSLTSSPKLHKDIVASSPIAKSATGPSMPSTDAEPDEVATITTNPDELQQQSEKKKDTLIPGFGVAVDESIHENAVKSISEPDERDTSLQSTGSRDEQEAMLQPKKPTTPPAESEDKPRAVISQEETEDAVAALLEETFGEPEDYSYENDESGAADVEDQEEDATSGASATSPAHRNADPETHQAVESLKTASATSPSTTTASSTVAEATEITKPDTPLSENDLQIDTDTEEEQQQPCANTSETKTVDVSPTCSSLYARSPMKDPSTVTPVAAIPVERASEPVASTLKPHSSPPNSVIAHSWNSRELATKTPQIEAMEPNACAAEPEPPCPTQPQTPSSTCHFNKQQQQTTPPLDLAKTTCSPQLQQQQQPLYQRLPVCSPQSQMMATAATRQSQHPASPASKGPLQQQSPISPNGQWRNPAVSPLCPKSPVQRIPVSVPISAHCPEQSSHIYSTAASQQPVIQHAPGMRAVAPNYPRGGLPPLNLNPAPRPYLPGVPPPTLLPSALNEPASEITKQQQQQIHHEQMLPNNKPSTSPKVPSPNQPPTYIPETAKIESSHFTNKSSNIDQITSPRKCQMQELQMLGTHVQPTPRSSEPSPVIVAHGQPHLYRQMPHHRVGVDLHPHQMPPSSIAVKGVVPMVSQQQQHLVDKCFVQSVGPIVGQKVVAPPPHLPAMSQGVLMAKAHVPVVSTVAQSIVVTSKLASANALTGLPIIKSGILDTESRSFPVEGHLTKQDPCTIKQEDALDVKHNIVKNENVKLESPSNIALKVEKQESPAAESIVKVENDPVHVTKLEPESIKPSEHVYMQTTPLEETKIVAVTEIEATDADEEERQLQGRETAAELAAKEDGTDSKEDSDYWSAKEVNIESVIKKVDALCDSESNEANEDDLHDASRSDADSWHESESMEDDGRKNSISANPDEQDEGIETEGSESSKSRRGSRSAKGKKTNARSGSAGVTTRRGKNSGTTGSSPAAPTTAAPTTTTTNVSAATSPVAHQQPPPQQQQKRATSAGRGRGKQQHGDKNSKLPADVYEFHDDSEEDNGGRPRLILTIKSPVSGAPVGASGANSPSAPTVSPTAAAPATAPPETVKDAVPQASDEFAQPSANTRKSRRLAEKDGTRSTVDDIIEDVVRGAANKSTPTTTTASTSTSASGTRRSARQTNNPKPTTAITTSAITTSTTTTTSQQALPANTLLSTVAATAVSSAETRKSPRASKKGAKSVTEGSANSSLEETNIDSDKAKEASPAPSDKSEHQQQHATVVPPTERIISGEAKPKPVVGPGLKAASNNPHEATTLIDPVTGMLIPMRESEEGQYIPVSTGSGQQQQVIQSAIRSATAASAIEPLTSQANIRAKCSTEVTAAEPKIAPTAVVTPILATQHSSVISKPHSPAIQTSASTAPTSTQVSVGSYVNTTCTTTIAATAGTKPTSLKAHVLGANKLGVATATPHPVVVSKPTMPTVVAPPLSTTVLAKPQQQVAQNLHHNVSPAAVATPHPIVKPIAPINGKPGQPLSPVLNCTGTPPNPKQHLLQAAKQQQQQQPQAQPAPAIVNLQAPKLPINAHQGPLLANAVAPRIHAVPPSPAQPAAPLKGVNGQSQLINPKAHLLQAVAPSIVTGTVASPPAQAHLAPQQPVVTGAPCARTTAPKPSVTGALEAPKVEVSMAGCIMAPAPSPQGRVISAYEASLHGSAAAVPSPGAQYGLVAPHRPQSPPLPPPAHHHGNAPQTDVVNHFGTLRPNDLPAHYLHPGVLQYQYLRAAAAAANHPYHHVALDPKQLETAAAVAAAAAAGGLEDTASPPLELRRDGRRATPHERPCTSESPQIAQMYMMQGRLPPPLAAPQFAAPPGTAIQRGGPAYYEPPPAHHQLRSPYQQPLPASEAPPERALSPERPPRKPTTIGIVAPSAAGAGTPPQTDSLIMLLQRYPVMWQGLLALKNDQAAVQMHFVYGNPSVARESLPCNSDGSTPPLRIAQRMRLEPTQVEGVARKMQIDNEHCMLLALPCGRDHLDVLQQSKNLQSGFITYLQQKQAAGIVNIAAPGSQQPSFVVHIFPSCDFANENLARIAPDLLQRVAEIAHLVIVIATV